MGCLYSKSCEKEEATDVLYASLLDSYVQYDESDDDNDSFVTCQSSWGTAFPNIDPIYPTFG